MIRAGPAPAAACTTRWDQGPIDHRKRPAYRTRGGRRSHEARETGQSCARRVGAPARARGTRPRVRRRAGAGALAPTTASSRRRTPRRSPPASSPSSSRSRATSTAWSKRRVIRVLTVQNPLLYFVDRGREVGITYELVKAFEKELNRKLGNKVVTVHVIAIPVARDQLLPRLVAGQGDIAAAALTITPERKEKVDFSAPARHRRARGARERARRAGGGQRRRPLGQGGLRPALERRRRAPAVPEQAAREGRQASGHDHARPGDPRGRRHPRDGGRRPRPGHGGGRLHRRPVRAGVPEAAEELRGRRARRSRSRGRSARARRSWPRR